MKRVLLFLFVVLGLAVSGFAQNDKISYQAVVRNSANQIVYNTQLTVTINITNGEDGDVVYSERHTVTSNANGLISLLIGDGEVLSGSWDAVPWNTAYMSASIANTGSSETVAAHALPLSAVPYAMYANYADSVNTEVIAHYLLENGYLAVDSTLFFNLLDSLRMLDLRLVADSIEFADYLSNTSAQIETTLDSIVYILNYLQMMNHAIDGDFTDLVDSIGAISWRQTNNYYTKSVIDEMLSHYATRAALDSTNAAIRADFPVVNNATLTIRSNGDSIGVFTANANENVTINIPAQANVQSDWNVTDTTSDAFIKHKPDIPTVPTNVSAFTNDAGYITTADIPTNVSVFTNDVGYITSDTVGNAIHDSIVNNISQQIHDSISSHPETDPLFSAWDKDYNDLTNKPDLFDGNYNSLTNKPSIKDTVNNAIHDSIVNNISQQIHDSISRIQIGSDNVQSDWTQTDTTADDYIKHKPELFSGNYDDLTNKPAIPTVPTNVGAFTNDAGYLTADSALIVKMLDSLQNLSLRLKADSTALQHHIAGTSTIPQTIDSIRTALANINVTNQAVNGDFSQLIADINTLTAQLNNDYYTKVKINDTLDDYYTKSQVDSVSTQIRSEIPAVHNATLTIKSNGDSIGVFTANANQNVTIDIPAQANVQSDWAQTDTTADDYIKHKPELFSGNYDDLANKPELFSGDYDDLTNKPELFDGDYNSLTSKPSIKDTVSEAIHDSIVNRISAQIHDSISNIQVGSDNVQSDWNQTDTTADDYIKHKPELFSGNYDDLTNKPTIPTVPTDVSTFTNDAGYLTSDSALIVNMLDSLHNLTLRLIADSTALQHHIAGTSTIPQTIDSIRTALANINVTNQAVNGDFSQLIADINTLIARLNNDYYTKVKINDTLDDYYTKTQVDSVSTQIRSEIPDVHNATLTIKSNGDSIGVFTANANQNVIIDIPAQANVQSDWAQTDTTADDYIKHKPELFSGNYGDLANKPELFSGDYDDLTNKPNIDSIAHKAVNDTIHYYVLQDDLRDTIGHYVLKDDLKDTIDYYVLKADIQDSIAHNVLLTRKNDTLFLTNGTEIDTVKLPVGFDGDYNSLTNKPELFDGNYNDLTNKPNIDSIAQKAVNDTIDYYVLKDDLKDTIDYYVLKADIRDSIAHNVLLTRKNDTLFLMNGTEIDTINLPEGFDGDYFSLTNLPQFATVATTGNYEDLTNKPTIPTVPTNVGAFTNDAGYLTADSALIVSLLDSFQNLSLRLKADSAALQSHLSGTTHSILQEIDSIKIALASINITNQAVNGDFSNLLNSINELKFRLNNHYYTILQVDSISSKIRSEIPAVHNATLTIKNNEESLGQFTANANQNVTIDVSSLSNVQSDWNQADNTKDDYIKNKPELFNGDYNSLTNKPSIKDTVSNAIHDSIVNRISAQIHDSISGITETDPTVPAWAKTTDKPTYDYSEIENTPDIPAAQVQSDWNATEGLGVILNKPTIPTVPTNISAFTNDAGFITAADIPNIQDIPTNLSEFNNDAGFITSYTETDPQFNAWDKDYNDLINTPSINDSISEAIHDSLNMLKKGIRDVTDTAYTSSLLPVEKSKILIIDEDQDPQMSVVKICQLDKKPNNAYLVKIFINGVLVGDNAPANGGSDSHYAPVLRVEQNSSEKYEIKYDSDKNEGYLLEKGDKIILYWFE